MACATLKRTLDWDPISPSHGHNQSLSILAHNLPITSNTSARPAKRRCSTHVGLAIPKEPSPFEEVHPKITSGKSF